MGVKNSADQVFYQAQIIENERVEPGGYGDRNSHLDGVMFAVHCRIATVCRCLCTYWG